MENDLISRSAAIELFKKRPYAPTWTGVQRELRQMPGVDAVEVVRCNDCKHYQHYGKTSLFVDGKNIKCGWCQRRIRYDEEYRMLPDDYCSYGERREEND